MKSIKAFRLNYTICSQTDLKKGGGGTLRGVVAKETQASVMSSEENASRGWNRLCVHFVITLNGFLNPINTAGTPGELDTPSPAQLQCDHKHGFTLSAKPCSYVVDHRTSQVFLQMRFSNC